MSLPTIHNVRLGFATNSSSMHSIVFLKGAKDHAAEDEVESCQFGWSTFTCASREAKMRYFGTMLLRSLKTAVGYDIAREVVRALAGVDVPEGAYIDHQSEIELPVSRDGRGPNVEFAREFREFLQRQDVVILGGNDNGDDDDSVHKLLRDSAPADPGIPFEETLIARKDPKGYWTLFNRHSGAKVRMSFDPPGRCKDVTKSTAPELVDVSITDKCSAECDWCYRDSRPNGQHASDDALWRVGLLLKELQPFEVAIGGGEPTEHPKFIDFLGTLHEAGIVPSFSTRSLDWLHHDERRPAILERAERFGYSVRGASDVEKLARILDRYGAPHSKATIHAIVGVSHLDSIFDACRSEEFDLLLLGFKRVGRGCNIKPDRDKDWAKRALKMRDDGEMPYNIAADTLLCAESEVELKALDISRALYATEEGKFSMFIDAVAETMGPSSFCEKKNVVKLPQSPKDYDDQWDRGAFAVLEQFAKW